MIHSLNLVDYLHVQVHDVTITYFISSYKQINVVSKTNCENKTNSQKTSDRPATKQIKEIRSAKMWPSLSKAVFL